MTAVQLVVTGRCEREGFHYSLRSVFPEVSFDTPVMVDSFTSTPLTEAPPPGVIRNLDKFAAKLVEMVDQNPDAMVVGIDDLELHGNPLQTVNEVRAAILRVLGGDLFAASERRRQRLSEQVAARCSFHLCVPMLDAYFFGEPDALVRAGALKPSLFDPVLRDCEQFEVNDREFLDPPDDPDSDWQRAGANRARHPKLYLKFLIEGPASYFREAHEGAAALRQLAWPRVLQQLAFTTFARALMADLADFVGVANPTPGEQQQITARGTQRTQRVLRNL